MKPILVLGAGGHARVLIDLLRQRGVDIIGLTDASAALHGAQVMDVPVLGDDESVFQYDPDQIELACGLGGIRSNAPRRMLVQRFLEQGYRFPALVHPTAYVGSCVEMGRAVQVMARATVQTGVQLGDNVIVNSASVVEHDCVIGSHVHVATGAILAGGVRVGEGAHIGAGATVLQGIVIGSGCVIGAGAVVIRNVPDGAVAVGVPVRFVERS